MAKTLKTLRSELAQQVGRYVTGTATGGSTTTIVDTQKLAIYTEDNALKGGYAYILAAGGSTPEGQSRLITSFVAATKTITVAPAFGAAVESGDTYEVYLSPLTVEQWNLAINLAIQDAYPYVWERVQQTIAITGATNYVLTTTAVAVDRVELLPTGTLAGHYGRVIPPAHWTVKGTPGVNLALYLLRPIPSTTTAQLNVFFRKPYGTLATPDASTDLDPGYVAASARAHWYSIAADAARNQADVAQFLQLMNHWQEIAERRKRELGAILANVELKKLGGEK